MGGGTVWHRKENGNIPLGSTDSEGSVSQRRRKTRGLWGNRTESLVLPRQILREVEAANRAGLLLVYLQPFN